MSKRNPKLVTMKTYERGVYNSRSSLHFDLTLSLVTHKSWYYVTLHLMSFKVFKIPNPSLLQLALGYIVEEMDVTDLLAPE